METYRNLSNVLDDFANIKNFVGNAADAQLLGTQGGWIEEWGVWDYSDNAIDATDALEAALATKKAVYIPKGIYKISRTINLFGATICGDGRETVLIADTSIPIGSPLFYINDTQITNIVLQYRANTPAYRAEDPGKGQRVLLQSTGESYHCLIERVWFRDCGTAIYDTPDNPYFGNTFSTLYFVNFRYRAIDLYSTTRTGNVFNMLFATAGGLQRKPGNLIVKQRYFLETTPYGPNPDTGVSRGFDWHSVGSELIAYDPNTVDQYNEPYRDGWRGEVFECTAIGSKFEVRNSVNGNRDQPAIAHELVDGVFSFGGSESESFISQIDAEWSGVKSFGINFSGITGLSANCIHFEKCVFAENNIPLININQCAGQINALTVLNTPINTSNNSIIQFNSIKEPYGRESNQPQTANYFKIGTLNLTNLGPVNRTSNPWTNLGDVVGLKKIYRPSITEGPIYLNLEHYYWSTFTADDAAYQNLPITGNIKLLNDGVYSNEPEAAQNNSFSTLFMTALPVTGPANNPTFTSIPNPKIGQIAYANTNKLYVYTGAKWKLL